MGSKQLICYGAADWTCLTMRCGYLSAGRRAPDRRGPSGDLGPLDPAIKVLEIESLGIKVIQGCWSTLSQQRLSPALHKVSLGLWPMRSFSQPPHV